MAQSHASERHGEKPFTMAQGWFVMGRYHPRPAAVVPPHVFSSAFPGFSQACPSVKVFLQRTCRWERGEAEEAGRCISAGFPEDCAHEAAPGEKEPLNCQNKKSSKLLRPIESTYLRLQAPVATACPLMCYKEKKGCWGI